MEEDKQLAPIDQLRQQGSPIQRLLGETLNELGGVDFLTEWAEDYPDQFMRLLLAANPAPVQGGQGGGGATLNVILPQGCGPGPLDVVSNQ